MNLSNPILDELRQTREQLLADAGGTLEGLVKKLQKDQAASGRVIISGQQSAPIDPVTLPTVGSEFTSNR